MRAKLTLCAAMALVLASFSASFAQTLQWDRTGDHLASYGPVVSTAPVSQRAVKVHAAAAPVHAATQVIDRTGDHMLYYGPIQ